MNYRRSQSLALFAAMLFGAAIPAGSSGATPPAAPRLAPLRVIEKTGGRISFDGLTSWVVVKLREEIDAPDLVAAPELAKSGPAGGLVASVAEGALPGGIRATFARPAEELRAEERRLERETGVDLADLSRYYDVETPSPRDAEALARRLERFEEVEFAYVRPEPLPPPSPVPAPAPAAAQSSPTPDLTNFQYYLGSAPSGFGILPVRDRPGGRGGGVRIVDIQYSWNLDHEDLPFDETRQPFVRVDGFDPFPEQRGNHGTAVIGMLVAADNGYGVTGICPDAEIGIINPQRARNDYRLAQAIDEAATILTRNGARGDVIQIELQARGVNQEISGLPPEWEPPVFDAVQRAVARGLVVVEPAGNGGFKNGQQVGVNLDRKELGGAFDRKKRDSGAIIVGGGYPVDAARTTTSNYGSRVDVQGYGAGVTTLGYGDLWTGGTPTTAYTAGFSGTSSAAACVTGVVAIVQASLREAGLPVLTSQVLRAVLAGTGTPDGSRLAEPIGPRPNLRLAADVVTRPDVPFITGIKYAKKKDRLVVDGLYLPGKAASPELRSVIYIDDVPVTTQYPDGFEWLDGSTMRVQATGVDALLPPKTIVYVTVGVGDEVRSPRRIFIRR